MYQVKQYADGNYQIYELIDSTTDSWVKVAPERGGIIISFGVQGKETLFLNKETFHNKQANIRGGIPILFPISGQLENGEYEWEGKVYQMKNHGLARNNTWEVIETTNTQEEATLKIALYSNEEMKKSFPFDFEVIFTYRLKGNKLTIQQEYTNKSESPMPIYAGFHPYFKTSSKNLQYESDAKTYLDYNDMLIKQVSDGLDLTGKKESLGLLDTVKSEIAFTLPESNRKIRLDYGDEFKYVILWAEEGQDFVCVEPWMANTKELNTKEELTLIAPNETLKTYLNITVE
jgi:galactose mutarotase-like enzyme